MTISQQHQLLFIHIPKVAGQSVSAALEAAFYTPTRRWFNKVAVRIGRELDWRVRWPLNLLDVYPPHRTALQWRNKLPRQTFHGLFKFAFVRNPWDRLVSVYHYILQDPRHPQHGVLKALGSFNQYVEWRVSEGFEWQKGTRPGASRALRQDLERDVIAVPQKNFLTDESGRMIVDFVGRYENLAQDFAHVCRQANLVGVSLPHINASSHRDYRTYYTARTRRLVEDFFRPDVKAFGYEFDQPHGSVPDYGSQTTAPLPVPLAPSKIMSKAMLTGPESFGLGWRRVVQFWQQFAKRATKA